jgi:hypothetical protein
MRSPSRLLARIEALELALKPKGRIFVFVDLDGDAASYEEREAAFRAEKGVGPGDELHSVRVTWDDPAEEPPGRCRTTRSGSLRGAKRRMRRLGSRAGSIRVERRVRVRDLGILDVEPILPVEPEATLVLDHLAPFLSAVRVRRPSTMPSAEALISIPTASKRPSVRRPSLPKK